MTILTQRECCLRNDGSNYGTAKVVVGLPKLSTVASSINEQFGFDWECW
jgi:hypothetical protein